MDPNEPHWRVNSSFSPPLSRGWDCRVQSDGLSQRNLVPQSYGSSLSSQHSKANRSGMTGHQHSNHHYSVSDGALSYSGSPSYTFQAPRWTSPIQRYDFGEFSTPAGGAKPEASVYPQCNERLFIPGASSTSNSLGSASPFLDSSRWASSSKQPIFLPPRHLSGRRSFMSKPVYPLVFRNPVSDCETSEMADTSVGSRIAPGDSNGTSPASTLSPDLKLHKSLAELQKIEASPEPGTSFMREGLRWSNASSYEFGFDGDSIDISEHTSLENLRSPNNAVRYQKCCLCERFLWQKSPLSSYRIVRSSDMPIAGVLPCSHVFHADCLEEATPKSQVHDPPCPVCVKADSIEASTSNCEPLHVALRSARRSQALRITSNVAGSSSNPNSDKSEGDLRRNQTLPVLRRGGSVFKDRLKKRLFFKGIGKDLFGTKVSCRNGSASISSLIRDNQNQEGGGSRMQ